MRIVRRTTKELSRSVNLRKVALRACIVFSLGLSTSIVLPNIPVFADSDGQIAPDQAGVPAALKVDGDGTTIGGVNVRGALGDGVVVTGKNCQIRDSVITSSRGLGVRVTGSGTTMDNCFIQAPRGIAIGSGGSVTIGRGPVIITSGPADSTDSESTEARLLGRRAFPQPLSTPSARLDVFGQVLRRTPAALTNPILPERSMRSPGSADRQGSSSRCDMLPGTQ